jgi:uncharacterized protein YegP (UPF0339 family)
MRVRFYKSKNGWRWTIYAKNGKKLANCGQGYSRRIDAVRGFNDVTGKGLRRGGASPMGWEVEGL